MPFENPLDRIVIPTDGFSGTSPFVDIGVARLPNGDLDTGFAGVAFYSPSSLPAGYAYIVRIAEVSPTVTTFVIQLYDHNNPGSPVKGVLSATYDTVTGEQIVNLGSNSDIIHVGPDGPNINVGPTDNSGSIDLYGTVNILGDLTLTGVAGDFSVGGDLTVTDDITCDDITVEGGDVRGPSGGTLHLGADNPAVHIGALGAFNQLFIGSNGNATDIQKDQRSTGWNYEATTDVAIAGTTTSATFAAMGGVATHSFVKERFNTRVGMGGASTWFTTDVNTGIELGINFNNGAGTNVTVTIAREQKTAASSRSGSLVGFAEASAAILPQGTYTVTLMWRRFTGAGTATVDANDGASFYTREEIAA